MRGFWRRRSRFGKVLIIVGAVLAFLIVLGLLVPSEDKNDNAAPATTAATTTEAKPATTAEATTAPEPTTAPKATTAAKANTPTPKQRVVEAVGDEVETEGCCAGTLKIRKVSFAGAEAQVVVTTPEGGFQGVSCSDLDDGAQAVFKKIYRDAGWKGGALVVFKGGLVNSATGQDLPDANTGIHTMPAVQARQIDWADDDVLSNINWSLYRDFCHPALK